MLGSLPGGGEGGPGLEGPDGLVGLFAMRNPSSGCFIAQYNEKATNANNTTSGEDAYRGRGV